MVSFIYTVVNTSSGKEPAISNIRYNGESRKKNTIFTVSVIFYTLIPEVLHGLWEPAKVTDSKF